MAKVNSGGGSRVKVSKSGGRVKKVAVRRGTNKRPKPDF